MPDLEGKAKALTQQELASQYLLAGRIREILGEAVDAWVGVLGLCAKEKTRLQHLGGGIRHDAVGEEEASQEDGSGRAYLGGEATELGGAEGLDGVEAQQLFLLGGGEEVGQRGLVVGIEEGDIGGGSRSTNLLRGRSIGTRRIGRSCSRDRRQRTPGGGRESFGDVLPGETVRFGTELSELAGREGPESELGRLSVSLVLGRHGIICSLLCCCMGFWMCMCRLGPSRLRVDQRRHPVDRRLSSFFKS